MTTLPSVSSLKILRQFTKDSRATKSFVGFGDPILEGSGNTLGGVDIAEVFSGGAIANVEKLKLLSRIPTTSQVLQTIAESLKAGEQSVYTQHNATERQVKSIDLAQYSIVAFATHGLLAQETKMFRGPVEPALVLTPPIKATDYDDGLLTASEVATLKLDAKWVLLIACNTAAPDGTLKAEGLSGLGKAFVYAGSRALLVSHWYVDANASVAIVKKLFEILGKNPIIGRSEALRDAMLLVMNDEQNPHYAHPLFWGPFVVVGEGGSPVNKH
jgi:CHAT domain-containing protein